MNGWDSIHLDTRSQSSGVIELSSISIEFIEHGVLVAQKTPRPRGAILITIKLC